MSADSGYASFLSSFTVGTDVSSRIRILKGPPFSYEFKNLIPKFKWTEFTNVFRSDLISSEPVRNLVWRRSQDLESQRTRDPVGGTAVDGDSTRWASRGNYQGLYATNPAVSEIACPVSKELAFLSRPRVLEAEHDGTENNINASEHLQGGPRSASSNTPSSPAPRGSSGESPTAGEIAAALIASTNKLLQRFPKNLDFGAVKQGAEQRLGVSPEFLGKHEGDTWFSVSKNIIKMAVVSLNVVRCWSLTDMVGPQEDWVERTDNPPPGNATWMLRYFNRQESPSAIMQSHSSQFWRTTIDLDLTLNFRTSDADVPHRHVFNQSEPMVKLPPNLLDKINAGSQPCPFSKGRQGPRGVYQNPQGQRVDVPNQLNLNPHMAKELRQRKVRLCNAHHLLDSCPNGNCPYDHESVLTDDEFEALLCLSRSVRCPFGSACTHVCCKGHMCPYGRKCRYGYDCKFSDLHDIDTTVSERLTGGYN